MIKLVDRALWLLVGLGVIAALLSARLWSADKSFVPRTAFDQILTFETALFDLDRQKGVEYKSYVVGDFRQSGVPFAEDGAAILTGIPIAVAEPASIEVPTQYTVPTKSIGDQLAWLSSVHDHQSLSFLRFHADYRELAAWLHQNSATVLLQYLNIDLSGVTIGKNDKYNFAFTVGYKIKGEDRIHEREFLQSSNIWSASNHLDTIEDILVKRKLIVKDSTATIIVPNIQKKANTLLPITAPMAYSILDPVNDEVKSPDRDKENKIAVNGVDIDYVSFLAILIIANYAIPLAVIIMCLAIHKDDELTEFSAESVFAMCKTRYGQALLFISIVVFPSFSAGIYGGLIALQQIWQDQPNKTVMEVFLKGPSSLGFAILFVPIILGLFSFLSVLRMSKFIIARNAQLS